MVADIVGYGRLIEADEEGTFIGLRELRSGLIDPAIATHNGRLVKRLGDGAIVEFRSVVEAVRCAMEVNRGLAERNTNLRDDQRIDVRVGIHLGDVVEEADGDLMGDGVNIAARLETICEPGKIFLSEDAYRQVRDKIHGSFADLGERSLKNVAWPMRVYALPAPAGGRRAIGPATAAAKVSASPRRKELHAGVATAVSAILDGLTATKKAGNERLANSERDAVGFPRVFPLVDWAARRRRRIACSLPSRFSWFWRSGIGGGMSSRCWRPLPPLPQRAHWTRWSGCSSFGPIRRLLWRRRNPVVDSGRGPNCSLFAVCTFDCTELAILSEVKRERCHELGRGLFQSSKMVRENFKRCENFQLGVLVDDGIDDFVEQHLAAMSSQLARNHRNRLLPPSRPQGLADR